MAGTVLTSFNLPKNVREYIFAGHTSFKDFSYYKNGIVECKKPSDGDYLTIVPINRYDWGFHSKTKYR